MEKVTRYKAIDGNLFHTEQECLNHEKIIERINVIMRPFGVKPDDCSFINGSGYIQHDARKVIIAKKTNNPIGC